ncbi:MAG: hypothetical protein U1E76_12585 [Planctomycetota bacterium]
MIRLRCSSSLRYIQAIVVPGLAGTLLLVIALAFMIEAGLIGHLLASVLVLIAISGALAVHLLPPPRGSLDVDDRESVG